MISIYWCPRTRAVRAVFMAEELGVEYELVPVDIRDQASKSGAAFRAASPMGKVPAIADGEVLLADSAAICLYLADRYPEAGLAPVFDDPARGRYLYWMVFVPGVMEPAMAEKMAGWETSKFSRGWGDYDSMIETLEGGLDPGPWLLGERFSAADVMVGSTVNFLKLFGVLPESAVLEAYCQRCLARPAYQRALAIDAEGG